MTMTIDAAVAHLGRVHVREALRSGKAYDLSAVASFNGRAVTAQLARRFRECEAYYVLAATPEPVLWQAIRSEQELREAFLEGSGRAMNELRRRGADLPENLAAHGAWL